MATEKKSVWYVAHPLHQYAEDVKALAREAGLRIVDANVVADDQRDDAAKNPPKLTIKGKGKPGKAEKAAPVEPPAGE